MSQEGIRQERVPTPLLRSDHALQAALESLLDAPVSAEGAEMAEFLARAFGPEAAALVQYGSRLRPEDSRPESAHDFFVLVGRYLPAYRSLASTTGTRYSPRFAALLNHVLPPNVISVVCPFPRGARVAKCVVLSERELEGACSPWARDHFARARLLQEVRLVWSRDAEARTRTRRAIASARATTFEWVRPFLPPRFDVEAYARTLLILSYGTEVRPEGSERIDELVGAQRDAIHAIYGPLLADRVARGQLAREGQSFRDLAPPGARGRGRVRIFFAWSKARSTLRWFKYVALYDDWLDYVVRKVERRGGDPMVLTPRERRWPLLFLWPRAIRFIFQARGRRR